MIENQEFLKLLEGKENPYQTYSNLSILRVPIYNNFVNEEDNDSGR